MHLSVIFNPSTSLKSIVLSECKTVIITRMYKTKSYIKLFFYVIKETHFYFKNFTIIIYRLFYID